LGGKAGEGSFLTQAPKENETLLKQTRKREREGERAEEVLLGGREAKRAPRKNQS